MKNNEGWKQVAYLIPLTDELEKGIQAVVVSSAITQAIQAPRKGVALIVLMEEQMWAWLDVTGELWQEARLADVNALLTTGGRPN